MSYKKYVNSKFSFITFFLGTIFAIAAIALTVALLSYNPHDRSFNNLNDFPISNMLGISGGYVADLLLQLFGLSSILFIIVPLFWSVHCLIYNTLASFWFKLITLLFAIILLSTLLASFNITSDIVMIPHGGAVGKLFYHMISVHHKMWCIPFIATFFVVCLYFSCGTRVQSWYDFTKKMITWLVYSSRFFCHCVLSVLQALYLLISRLKKNKHEQYQPYHNLLEEINKTFEPVKMSYKPIIQPNKKTVNQVLLPTQDLLNSIGNKSPKNNVGTSILEDNANKLLGTLSDFGVKGKILGYYPGPVVTLYELEPAAGTKSSRIIG